MLKTLFGLALNGGAPPLLHAHIVVLIVGCSRVAAAFASLVELLNICRTVVEWNMIAG